MCPDNTQHEGDNVSREAAKYKATALSTQRDKFQAL